MNYQQIFMLFTISLYTCSSGAGITGLEPIGTPIHPGQYTFFVSWCDNCNYLATGGKDFFGGALLQVYEFDTETISLLTSVTIPVGIGDYPLFGSAAWCGNNCGYLAAAGMSAITEGFIHVYKFDTETLSLLASVTISGRINAGPFTAVAWCDDDCKYLAAGGMDATNKGFIHVYNFDITNTNTLSLLASVTISSGSSYSTFSSVSWCCDDYKYLAAGGMNSTQMGILHVYKFDPTVTNTLSLITSVPIAANSWINAVAWCGDNCEYLAAGGYNSAGKGLVQLYSFDKNTETVSLITTETIPASSTIYSIAWCGDNCEYLAAGGYNSAGKGLIQLYSFDESAGTLSLAASATITISGTIYSASCCGDCEYLATAGMDSYDGIGFLQLYKTIREQNISAPTLHAQKSSHRFPTQLDIINTICWDTVTDAVLYNVYADSAQTILLASITSRPYCYSQHRIIPCTTKTYYVTAVDADGNESDPATITI